MGEAEEIGLDTMENELVNEEGEVIDYLEQLSFQEVTKEEYASFLESTKRSIVSAANNDLKVSFHHNLPTFGIVFKVIVFSLFDACNYITGQCARLKQEKHLSACCSSCQLLFLHILTESF